MSGTSDNLYGRIAAVSASRPGSRTCSSQHVRPTPPAAWPYGAKLVADAKLEGWRIVGLDGTDSNTVSQADRPRQLLVAEEERELISKRTKQGLIKARQAGKRLGKPSTIEPDVVGPASFQIAERRNGNEGHREGA